jgi:16S rRNA (guanine527-N7)-methyltransferase
MSSDTESLRPILSRGLERMALPADDALIESLLAYLAELIRWNKAYNLTSVRDPQEMVIRHLLDSYSVQPYICGTRTIDVGTGAGLPGIPLALANPEKFFVLLDSNGKKVRFLQHVVGALGIHNVTPVQSRVAEYKEDAWFDTVVCRAFTSLAEFVTNSGHLASPEGRLVAMKGKLPTDELEALPEGWQVQTAEPVAVPGLEGERHVIVIRRVVNDDIGLKPAG